MSLYNFTDGKKYINYDNWLNYRNTFHYYENPRQRGRFRADIELVDDPIKKYPEFWYACDEWTFITDSHEVTHPNGNPSIRGIIESNHHHGERVILYSTFSGIFPEPWGTGVPQVFAYFKDRLWRVSYLETMLDHEWKGYRLYPLSIRHHEYVGNNYNLEKNYQREDYLRATFLDEHEDETGGFIRNLIESEDQHLDWLVLADWLQERNHELYKFIRSNINKIKDKPIPPNRMYNLRTLTAMAVQFFAPLYIRNHPIRGHSGICAGNPSIYIDTWYTLSMTPTVIQPTE